MLHREPWVVWMDQSLFEGDELGASDLPLFLYGIVLFWYTGLVIKLVIKGAQGEDLKTRRVRRLLGRVLVTGVCIAGATHALKWGLDRPRPKDVLRGACGFRDWFQLGPTCGEASQGKSFPSGHTATAASLWAMNMAWFRWMSSKNRQNKCVYYVFAGLVLVFAGAMGLARVIHGDHWLTDTLASILLGGWIVMILWRKETPWA